jgi:DNA-directed RNA polymerase subunit M/transcription elongation factor TFIIS
MAKSKLETPDWIREGFDSKEEYEKSHGLKKKKSAKADKIFKIKLCPKCGSDDVQIVLSNLDSEEESNTGKMWECKKCKWKGKDVDEKEVTEDEFMEYLDKRGEEVA